MKNRMLFPGIRLIVFQIFNGKPLEKFFFPIPVSMQGRHKQTFSEAAGAAQEVLPAGMNQGIKIFCLICINASVFTQVFK